MAISVSGQAPPVVSIGLPVYNGGQLLRQALDSLLAQDFPEFELIISDNASTDETADICREYAARDSRITYYRCEVNTGAVPNFNRVFKLARGKYFMWAAHDDVCHPAFLRRCIEALEANANAVMCHSYGQPFLHSGRAIGEPYVGWVCEQPDVQARWRTVMRDWRLHAATYGLMRRAVAARTRLLQLSLAADLIFVAEMVIHGSIIQVPEVLQWKRVPDPGQPYHTHRSMLAYLGHHRPRSCLLRLEVSLQLLWGLRHAHLKPPMMLRLAWATIAAYMTRRYWLIDAKEFAANLLGSRRTAAATER